MYNKCVQYGDAMICTVKTYLPSLIASVVSGLACQYNVNHYFFLY